MARKSPGVHATGQSYHSSLFSESAASAGCPLGGGRNGSLSFAIFGIYHHMSFSALGTPAYDRRMDLYAVRERRRGPWDLNLEHVLATNKRGSRRSGVDVAETCRNVFHSHL